MLPGCRDDEREKRLNNREQVLIEKENQFALKEADYESLLKLRDSLLGKKDTIFPATWPPEVKGFWNSKEVCTESNCNDYIIGDQRSNLWEFDTDSSEIVAKIINRNKLVRVYQATYTNNLVQLNYSTDSTERKKVIMNVVLNEAAAGKLKGTRIISINNNCIAKFSVELNRVSDKD